MKRLQFRPEHRKLVLKGKKTETRRFSPLGLSVGDLVEAYDGNPDSEINCSFCWETGEDPVKKMRVCRWCNGRMKLPLLPFAILRITRVFEHQVIDLTDEDANVEGYKESEIIWKIIAEATGELDFQAMMFGCRFNIEKRFDDGNAEEQIQRYDRART